jgi:hypothetical protein
MRAAVVRSLAGYGPRESNYGVTALALLHADFGIYDQELGMKLNAHSRAWYNDKGC